MTHGTFKTIDDVINNFNLVGGMSLSFGNNSKFSTSHFDINANNDSIPFKEGWIKKISLYYAENEETGCTELRTDITIELKLYCSCAERPTMIVNKSWFDKNVSNISVWGIK